MSMRRLLGLFALLGAGCLSPTLPLPPPEEPSSMTLVRDGVWGIAGTCDAGAEVVVLDEVSGRGAAFVDLDRTGHYYVEIEAALCDLGSITQSSRGEDSGKRNFVVHPRVDGQPDTNACSP